MTDIQQIKEILKSHKDELRRRFKVKSIGVFGSYVRGAQGKRSDIDVLVEFEEPVGFFEFIDLEDYLSDLLGKRVDLFEESAQVDNRRVYLRRSRVRTRTRVYRGYFRDILDSPNRSR